MRSRDIPFGSVAFLEREKRLLLPGDSVQKDGPIFMFGDHRSMDLYIRSQEKLCTLSDQIDQIIPCHHEYPISPVYIERNLQDALAVQAGNLKREKHPFLPVRGGEGKVDGVLLQCIGCRISRQKIILK